MIANNRSEDSDYDFAVVGHDAVDQNVEVDDDNNGHDD